jgi:translocator protein
MLRSGSMLLLFLGLSFGAAALGASWTETSAGSWYRTLERPAWSPPDWVFGPVWTTLYVLMAVAAWLVWRRAGLDAARGALALWALQLALNAAWSGIFFGMQKPGAAFFELLGLWVAIAATIAAFWPIHTAAAGLMLPYLAWVSFAGALNLAIWRMNP